MIWKVSDSSACGSSFRRRGGRARRSFSSYVTWLAVSSSFTPAATTYLERNAISCRQRCSNRTHNAEQRSVPKFRLNVHHTPWGYFIRCIPPLRNPVFIFKLFLWIY